MKKFNLELTKQVCPVCTRDGRRARILCFDFKDDYFPICAAVENEDGIESSEEYTLDGRYIGGKVNNNADLMMAQEKHEGWVNIATCDNIIRFVSSAIHSSGESAKKEGERAPKNYITTVKIEWEE